MEHAQYLIERDPKDEFVELPTLNSEEKRILILGESSEVKLTTISRRENVSERFHIPTIRKVLAAYDEYVAKLTVNVREHFYPDGLANTFELQLQPVPQSVRPVWLTSTVKNSGRPDYDSNSNAEPIDYELHDKTVVTKSFVTAAQTLVIGYEVLRSEMRNADIEDAKKQLKELKKNS